MIGLRVRQVRELLGWSQTQLAGETGLPQPLISTIETGTEPTREQVEAIATGSGFPVDWFLRPPLEAFPQGTIRFRKKASASKKEDRRAVRRLELAAELVALLSADETLRLPPVTLRPIQATTSDDIEAAAQETREALGLSASGPMRNLIRAAERAGAIVVGIPVDLGTTSRIQHHHGVSAWPEIEERPVIGFSTTEPGDRQRHTLGHEIGHLVLHRGGGDASRNYEAEASNFAGALLMPYDDAVVALGRNVTMQQLVRLKAAWGVSIAGLIVRAHQVGVITADRQTSLFKQLSARGWRTREPVVVHREQPALLRRLIEAQFGINPDWRQVARDLGLPPYTVRELVDVAARDIVDGPVADHLVVNLASRRQSNG